MTYFTALLARACEIAGQIEEALTLLDDALLMVKNGEGWFVAELNRLKGQLLLRQGHIETAEKLYRKALSIARLRRDQGQRAEARDLLAPVYDWFTEGFTTADFKEAKALLDELT